MSTKSKLLKILVPICIILLGVLGTIVLIKARTEPQKTPSVKKGALVQVMELSLESRQVVVHATGTVEASQRVEIVPQVSGRVDKLAPAMVAGGFFRKGELLFRVEDIDYRLAVDRARAAVAKAEFNLAREEGSARVARQEWDRLQADNIENPNPLVLNEPQLNNARAELVAAGAALRQAEVDLERTSVKAPFDSMVTAKNIDLGQYVRAGTGVAMVSGTDLAEIIVPLPPDEAGWLDIPMSGRKEPGSKVVVRHATGGREYTWEGRVSRSLGVIDPVSRMARLVVEVSDPYNLRGSRPADQPALAMGMFVEVNFLGEPLTGVIAIPRRAVHENNTVWLMDEDNTLRMRRIEVLRMEQNQVLVREGVVAGERLVLTKLSGAVEGMPLRPLETGIIESGIRHE
jgi:RND family efflux transporter MFP subunit